MNTDRLAEEVRSVVVPLDGWPDSERGLLPAQHLARRLGVPLLLLSTVEDEHEVNNRRIDLETRAALLDEVDVRVEVAVDPHVLDTLLAHDRAGELVVMATSGHTGLHDGYVGSMAEKVLRRSGHPTVLVGRHVELGMSFDIGRVVVALDGSKRAEVAAQVGAWWATRLGVQLWLVQVLSRRQSGDAEQQSRYLRHVALELDTDADAQWDVLHGRDVADELLDAAGTDGLLVVATHGRTGLSRMVLGSVANEVTRRSTQPVVVVAAPDLEED
ncbi:MAG: universal stress protein [Acidimicrobiales bacterium]|nr:universal stress protein [Acidimicrobiales bacterium]